MANRIQLRRDTSANWATINPILADGEPGLEIDTNKIKYGDGTHGWVSLSYSGNSDPTRLVNGSSQAVLAPDGALLLSNLIEWPGADGGLQAGSSAWILHQDGSTRFPHYTFPASDGSANQVLQTNGSGVLSWETISTVTDQLVNGSYTVALNSSGVLTVPGAIQSTNGIVISNAGVVGATAGIVLPSNTGTTAVQIGNTYGPIQLAAAAGGGTELNWTFGTDGILILPQTGSGAASITSGTNGLTIVANSHTWEFAPDGGFILPGYITSQTGLPLNLSSSAGSNATFSNSSGSKLFVINDTNLLLTNESNTWTFGNNGTLTFPDASVQTSAYQYKTIMSAFGASGPNIQIDNAQFSYNNAGNPTVAAVSGTWSGPWTAEATVYNGTSFVTTTYGSTSATWTSVAAYGIGITFGNAGDKAVAYFTDDTNGHIYKVTWIASSTNPTTNCTTIVEKLI